MSRITVRLDSAEQRALVEIARSYDGNLAAGLRSLIHREAITKAVVSSMVAELKAALLPLIEASETVLANQSDAALALKHNFGVVRDDLAFIAKKP